MPKTKAPPPASAPSLDGVAVTFASFFTNAHPAFATKNIASMKADIANCGGIYTTKLESATHIVATLAQVQKNLNRIKEALQNPQLIIVSYDWLADSLASNSPVDVNGYLLGPSPANSNGGNAVSDNDEKQKKPSKRTRQDVDDDEDLVTTKMVKPSSKGARDDQKKTVPASKANKPKIPVDEHCNNSAAYNVYVDDDGTAWNATLNMSDSIANNNKFYRIQLLVNKFDEYFTWTRWGRVGDKGQSKMLGNGSLDVAITEFKKKFKDKHGNTWEDREGPQKPNKYTLIEINYEDSDNEDGLQSQQSTPKREYPDHEPVRVKSQLAPSVQRLMELIFNLQLFDNTMASFNYDANKMPLGKLSKKTVLRAYEVLKELTSLVADRNLMTGLGLHYDQAIADRSNQYFSLVPHAVGRRSVPLLQDMGSIKREIQLLETLTDMQLANEIMNSAKVDKYKQQEHMNILDRQYMGLGMQEMTPLDITSQEYREIHDYLKNSKGGTHGVTYQVQDIFRIERNGESDRLNKSPYANLGAKSDRRLLWHGSRCSNFGGILSQGLRIAPPEAPVSGYMFGKGVYLADMSSKSAGYCASHSSGGTGLLLLCEAELGKPPLKLTNADYNAGDRAKANNSISTWGVGQTAPKGWKDASCINTNLKGVLMPDVLSQPPGPSNEASAYLLYNEYIVYDVAQIKLRYLLRVSMT
ncbi:uncharacterized protein Z518_00980 [Rhinocladiella mackenziei CBS 650.93]|uniref:Poly [ADP-ribose] polymerase n=1 Tax=Rhinocladiella mackenziei CBS 650.93 TaxID=1442369 RepID=A0A0D2IUY5_9EURO|nr:uncharacterized protein Z518_00980 [Rhinocladiella mackenziei CBS 650.93]KIX09899.1 hypothetical protein Z518_00980 [Rhinocladiella mackenziei CBS 650.93]